MEEIYPADVAYVAHVGYLARILLGYVCLYVGDLFAPPHSTMEWRKTSHQFLILSRDMDCYPSRRFAMVPPILSALLLQKFACYFLSFNYFQNSFDEIPEGESLCFS